MILDSMSEESIEDRLLQIIPTQSEIGISDLESEATMLLDLDDSKGGNDELDHPPDDRILRSVADAVRAPRPTDDLGRRHAAGDRGMLTSKAALCARDGGRQDSMAA